MNANQQDKKSIFDLADKFGHESPFDNWMEKHERQLKKRRSNGDGDKKPGNDYYAVFQGRLKYLGTDGGDQGMMRYVSWDRGQMGRWSALRREFNDDLTAVTEPADITRLFQESTEIVNLLKNDESEASFFKKLFDKGAHEEIKFVREHGVDVYFDPELIALRQLEIFGLRGHNFLLGRDQEILRRDLKRNDIIHIANIHTHNAADNYDEIFGEDGHGGRKATTQRQGDGKAAIECKVAVFSIDSEHIIKHPPDGAYGVTGEAPIGTIVKRVTTPEFFSGRSDYSIMRHTLEVYAGKEK